MILPHPRAGGPFHPEPLFSSHSVLVNPWAAYWDTIDRRDTAMALLAGTRLGPYEIVAPIGAGGMGEVYRAQDSRLERDVAVKVLPEHLSQNPQALARFVRETKTVAALSHPNLLAIFDTGTEHGISYAVTELLDGESLRARLMRGPTPWRKAGEIGAALADGLAAA